MNWFLAVVTRITNVHNNLTKPIFSLIPTFIPRKGESARGSTSYDGISRTNARNPEKPRDISGSLAAEKFQEAYIENNNDKKKDTSRELQEMMGMATSQCFQKIKRQNFAMTVTTALWDFYFIFLFSSSFQVFKNYSVSHEYVTSRNHNDPYNITTLRTFLRIHQEREIKRE